MHADVNPTFKHALVLVLGLLLAALGARPGIAAGLDVSHFTLGNGLEVVVIPDHRAPVVTHMVWYKVGSADETAGESGLAHFLEHLMFKGTKKNPIGRYSQTVSTLGGQENAFTTDDYTAYYQRVPRERLKTLMEFESDRMTGLVLTDAVVKPELQVVLEEQNMRVANNPGARLSEQMEAALYLNHPYGRPVIGWRHEIEKLDREGALAFYRRFYTPNNAVLVVAGDVTPDEVKVLAEETYGKVERVIEVGPRDRPKEPVQEAARTVTLADSRVTQPSLRRIYLRIKHDPHRTEYMDLALTPVMDDETETRELFRSAAAQSYVGQEQHLDKFRRNLGSQAARAAAEHELPTPAE